MYCFVTGCPNSSSASKEAKKARWVQIFFSAPEDEGLFRQWQAAIPSSQRPFSRSDKLCDFHFKKSEVILFNETKLPNGNVRRVPASEPKLKAGTVPTVFPMQSKDEVKGAAKGKASTSEETEVKKIDKEHEKPDRVNAKEELNLQEQLMDFESDNNESKTVSKEAANVDPQVQSPLKVKPISSLMQSTVKEVLPKKKIFIGPKSAKEKFAAELASSEKKASSDKRKNTLTEDDILKVLSASPEEESEERKKTLEDLAAELADSGDQNETFQSKEGSITPQITDVVSLCGINNEQILKQKEGEYDDNDIEKEMAKMLGEDTEEENKKETTDKTPASDGQSSGEGANDNLKTVEESGNNEKMDKSEELKSLTEDAEKEVSRSNEPMEVDTAPSDSIEENGSAKNASENEISAEGDKEEPAKEEQTAGETEAATGSAVKKPKKQSAVGEDTTSLDELVADSPEANVLNVSSGDSDVDPTWNPSNEAIDVSDANDTDPAPDDTDDDSEPRRKKVKFEKRSKEKNQGSPASFLTQDTLQQILTSINLPLNTPVKLALGPDSSKILGSQKTGIYKSRKDTGHKRLEHERLLGVKMFEGLGKIKKSFDYTSFLTDVDDVQYRRLCLLVKECLNSVKESKNAVTNIGKLNIRIVRKTVKNPYFTPKPLNIDSHRLQPHKAASSPAGSNGSEFLECATVESSIENHYEGATNSEAVA